MTAPNAPESAPAPGGIRRTELHDGWTATITDGPAPFPVERIRATVPGTLITDLLGAGLIPDPYLDQNERALAWTGECDVVYATTFSWTPSGADRTDLVADSLDTAATIVLNGTEIARVQNQHRSWRFDVTGVVVEGDNRLEIRFASPLRTARENTAVLGDLPFVGNELPYNAIRKMACNLGWDWGPVLVTSGIAGPIALEEWSVARLASVRPLVSVEDGTGVLTVDAEFESAAGPDQPDGSELSLVVHVEDPDGAERDSGVVPGDGTRAECSVRVPDARLWWPRGYGEQPLYRVRVELRDADGTVLDSRTRRVGFRTAGVIEETDEIGTSFTVVVNDRPILIKGGNWIPDDCFPTRLTAADYARGVRDAVDAGMNMLRIWGGGLYESDILYELCDEQGVLVWQDFALACAAYSEEPPLRDEIVAEAAENIVRLAWHPSLVHWNGSNENVEGYYEWGWKDSIPAGTGWGDLYYTEIFPSLLAELDPTRSYSPSSPYSRGNPENPRDPDHGTIHNWEVWNRVDYTHYRDTLARFSAEFGFQAPASSATIERAITERPLDADAPVMLAHQKAADGQDKLRRGYAPHFPEPTSFDDFVATTQMNQAAALTCGIGHYRSLWPVCAGTIVWQLNDCWPVTSWSAVDGDGRRKLLWYALRDIYADVLLTIQPRGMSAPDGGTSATSHVVSVGNDTDDVLEETLRVRRQDGRGNVLAEHAEHVRVGARSAAEVAVPPEVFEPSSAEDAAHELVVATMEGRPERALWWHAEIRDADLPPQAEALTAAAHRNGDTVTLELEAHGTVRDLCVFADRADPDAVADRQLVTLLPGERTRIEITSPSGVDAAAFLDPRVLVTGNGLRERGRIVDLASSGEAPVAAAYAGPQGAS